MLQHGSMSVHEQVRVFYTVELCELYEHLFFDGGEKKHTH